jgi:hypothetical protein
MMKEYLGDSVYADFDGFQIVLTTENGYGATNTIYMEPDVVAAFLKYKERVDIMRAEANRQQQR